ncbi:S8 family serine peptidase, partial [Flammeovirga sp. OC4]|uniref:S8 family serine peptidase n=1 Tax=Flammeovirga sp. OC4 TaxID=1382345 RepID=UPI00155DCF3E
MLLILVATEFIIAQQNTSLDLQKYEEHIIRVKLKGDRLDAFLELSTSKSQDGILVTGDEQLDRLNKKFGITKLRRVFPYSPQYEEKHKKYGLHLWYELVFSTNEEPSEVAQQFSIFSDFEISKPVNKKVLSGGSYSVIENREASILTQNAFNDPLFAKQWHYHNIGQNNGDIGADISLLNAWQINSGDNSVIVAVTDAGIDTDHIDLSPNIWVNENEIPNNGIDDDGNGYVDDIHGFNFAQNNSEIEKGQHGTHVGGTIAAVNNNSIGVAGVAGGNGSGNGVKLMSCMAFTNGGFSGSIAQSYVYAADNGAVISQNSWGHSQPTYFDQEILDAIDYFIAEAGNYPNSPMKGGLVIFAAGNDNDDDLYYPGYYEPILTVGATTNEDKKAYYSNYGDWVDVVAPGGETIGSSEKGVLSTLPNDNYGFFQGTSMACPHVSGVAALVVSAAKGTITNSELRQILEQATDDISSQNPLLNGKLGNGRINAEKALKSIQRIGVNPEELVFDFTNNEPLSKTVTIFNISNEEVPFDLSNNIPSFTFNIVSGVLGIGESKEITITLDPSSFEFGNYEENISFDTETYFKLTARINKYELPKIYIDSTKVDFGEVYEGYTVSKQIEIYNHAFAELVITDIQTNQPHFKTEVQNITIPPYGNVFLPITFSATSSASNNATLSFLTNDKVSPTISIPLSASTILSAPPLLSSPEEITLKQAAKGILSTNFPLQNDGDDDLTYSFQQQITSHDELSELTLLKTNYFRQLQLEKGENHAIRGRETLQHYGSSTNYFYQWVDQEISGGVLYQWNDIQSIGNHYNLHDEGSLNYNLKLFQFPFYGTDQENIVMSSNGYLQFGDFSQNQWENTSLPFDDETNAIISGYWTDLDSVDIYIVEENDQLTIQYEGQYYNSPKDEVKFQIVLHKSGSISLFYHTVGFPFEGTVGIENNTAEEGLNIAFNNNYLKSGTAISIIPNSLQLEPLNGAISTGAVADIQLFFDSNKLFEAGYQLKQPLLVYSNDPIKPATIIPLSVQFGDVVLELSDTVIVDTSFISNPFQKEILIYNKGYENLILSDLSTDVKGLVFDQNEYTVLPNDSLVLNLTLYSEVEETIDGTIIFKTNDRRNPSIEIPVSIYNKDYPQLEINVDEIQIEGYYQRIKGLNETFVLKNVRSIPLDVSIEVKSDHKDSWLNINDSTILEDFSLDENFQERTLLIEVKENLPSGNYTGQVLVHTNDPFKPEIIIDVDLIVNPSPHLSIVDFIQFDQRYIDSTNVYQAIIENIGDVDLQLHVDPTKNHFFDVINTSPINLSPNSVDTLEIGFNPQNENYSQEDLIIVTNMPDTIPYVVTLSGNGIYEKNIQITESYDDFEIDYNETSNGRITLQNTSEQSQTYKIVAKEKKGLTSSQIKNNIIYNDGFNVLLLGSGKTEWLETSIEALYNTKRFTSVSGINVSESTPTLEDIESFDVIVVNGIFGYDDPVNLGNILYDYIENGGSVVLSAFVNLESSDQIQGKWNEVGYDPILVTDETLGTKGNGIKNNGSVLLNGVTFFDTYNRIGIPSSKIKPNVEVLLEYNDGVPFLLNHKVNGKNIFYVNSYTAYWIEESDGGQLFANVIEEAYKVNAGTSLSWFTSPNLFEGVIDASQTLDFNFSINEHLDILEGEHTASLQVFVQEGKYDVLKSTSEINVKVQAQYLISIDSQFTFQKARQYDTVSKRIIFKNEGAGYFMIDQIITSTDQIVIDETNILENRIDPYSENYLDITYTASQIGTIQDSITIKSLEGDEIVFKVNGEVVPNGTLDFINPLEINIEHGEIKTITHTFSNSENGPVDFLFSSYYEDVLLNQTTNNHTITAEKNIPPLIPLNDGLSTSESDGKYTYLDSRGENGIHFQWIDITSTGTLITLEDDAFFTLHNPQWDFILYEKHYENIIISSNGYFTFDPVNGRSWKNHELPNASKPYSIIAPLWTDLAPQKNGTIHYLLDDEKLIVQYTQIPTYDDDKADTSFQLIYWKDGILDFNYKNIDTENYSVGIENYAGNSGVGVAYNTSYLDSDVTIHWVPPKRKLEPLLTRFSLAANESKEISFKVNADSLFYDDSFEETILIKTSNPKEPYYNLDIAFNVLRGIHIKDSIPDQSVILYDTIKIDLTEYFFSSLENNELEFSLDPNAYITSRIEQGQLYLSVQQFFNTPQILKINAFGDDILKHQSFVLTTSTTKPYPLKKWETKELLVGQAYEFNLAKYFGFPTDNQSFSIEVENEVQGLYQVTDSILTLSLDSLYNVENPLAFKVVASNSDGKAEQHFTFISYNNLPKGNLDDIFIDITDVDTSYTIDPSIIYSDEDGHQLEYQIASYTNTIIDVKEKEGAKYEISPIAKGIDSLILQVSDSYEYINDTVTITVGGNFPPVLNFEIENQSIALGLEKAITISELFTDPEDQELSYTIDVSNDNIQAIIDENLDIQIIALEKGVCNIEIGVTDGEKWNSISFKVTTFNNEPVVEKLIVNENLYLTDSGFNIDLDTLFEDIDGQPLTYTIVLENEAVVDFTSSSSNYLTFIPKSIGSSEVTITASDQYSEIAQTFDITVLNRQPHLMKRVESQELYLTDLGFNLDLDTLFEDIDGQPLTYTITLENESVVDFTSSSSNYFIFTPKSIGSSAVTITASDQYSEIAQTFDITVLNRQPHLMQRIEPQELYLTDTGFNVDLDTLFEDIDGQPLTYTIVLENEAVVDFTSSSSNYLTFIPKSIGSSEVTITASDQYSEIAQTFDITVLNRQPHLMKRVESQELYLTDLGFNLDLDTL